MAHSTASEADAGTTASRDAASGFAVPFADRLGRVPAAARRDLFVDLVRREVAGVLGWDASQPMALDTGLFEMGMDSLMSVELKRRLERAAERSLPSTLTFNYPSVAALASFLETEFSAVIAEAVIAAQAPLTLASASESGDLAMLSDAELEARLLARLEQSR